MAKPFLKWVGGKRKLLPELVKRIPKQYSMYYEPFFGGGALFFELKPNHSVISDSNKYLMTTYMAVKDNVERVINEANMHIDMHNVSYYYAIRNSLNTDDFSAEEIAGRIIYLNKTGFNGLFRVNKNNKINVPIGDCKSLNLDEVCIREASEALQCATIINMDYTTVIARENTFYYFDPPYHGTYSSYTKNGFNDAAHAQLANLCKQIDKSGGYFLVSNSNTEYIKSLYNNYTIEEVLNGRSVSCKADGRKKTTELLIRNYDF
jgi:DNA adenine methylase